MGNQQSVYSPFTYPQNVQQGTITQSVQYGSALGATGVPVTSYNIQQNDDCCSPNVPNSLQGGNCCGPNYGAGITNTGLYGQSSNQCCNWNQGVVNQGINNQGYAIGASYSPQSVDECCCGPSNYMQSQRIPIVPPSVQTYGSQINHLSNTAPVQSQFPVGISSYSQIPMGLQFPQPLMKTSFVASQLPVIDPTLNVVIQTDVYRPASTIVEVNPFTNLPTRILSVIERLGSVNPLRGSIMNRLETPQYVAQKQAYYEGQWINGYMQGFGRLYFDSGAYFEGEFVNGLAQTRHGLFIYPDGSYYIGGVDKNVANGQGQFNYRNGRLIYKGQFLNDQPDGKGVQLYSDGSKYQGEFRFGKKEGRGEFVWRDGTVYNGQFQNGFMQGQGVHHLSNGETYKGQFRKNKRHGRGTHITSLGTYTGGYKRDKKEGEGQFSWADGKVFKGTFHNGKPDGQGSLLMLDGTTVYGIWINGVLDQNSLTANNPFRGSQIQNPRSSIVSVGSVGSLQNVRFDSNIARTSQIIAGPPVINLKGGILGGGFIGKASPFVNNRGSVISVVGPGGDFRGSSIPRGSSIQRGSSVPRGSSIPSGSSMLMGHLNTAPAPIMRGSSVNILSSKVPIIPAVRPTGYPRGPSIIPQTSAVQVNQPVAIAARNSTIGVNSFVRAPSSIIPRGSQVIQTPPSIIPGISRTSTVAVNAPIGITPISNVGSVGNLGLNPVIPSIVGPPLITPTITSPRVTQPFGQPQILPPTIVSSPPTPIIPPSIPTIRTGPLSPINPLSSVSVNSLTPRGVSTARFSSVSPSRGPLGPVGPQVALPLNNFGIPGPTYPMNRPLIR